MRLSFATRHYDIPDDIREYAEKKLSHLERFFDRIIDVHVILSAEKRSFETEITVQANGISLHGKSNHEDLRTSIDSVVKKMERQLKKYKDRLKNHRLRTKDLPEETLKVDVLEGKEVIQSSDDSPRVIRSSRYNVKPMSIEEAVMQMDMLDQEFLAFTNTRNSKMSVIYRRKDGNYGLIEPE